jgi:hypothetical protein
MPRELQLRKYLMITIGQEIGPMLDGFTVVEVAVILSALFNQTLRGLNESQRAALVEILLMGNT